MDHHKLNLLLIITIILLSSTNARTSTSIVSRTTKPTRRLVSKLIHHDSILFPYYNSHNVTLSKSELVSTIQSSTARYTYLKESTKNPSTTKDVRGGVIPDYGGIIFLVNISIGQPPVPQLVAMETRSNLFWVQCHPCINCFEQLSTIFDPSKSSTYYNISCNSTSCVSDTLQENCVSVTSCPYHYKYADSSTTRGDLGREEVRFISNKGTSVLSNILFGCGHENYGFVEAKENYGYNGIGLASGVLGHGPSKKLSLVSHLGSRFSYCIGNMSDLDYEYNRLVIGDDEAEIKGYSTPIQVFNNMYCLTVEGISVGEKQLEIDPHTFKRNPSSGEGGVIIDTGTTLTILDTGGYIPLITEVQSLIGGILPKLDNLSNPDRLCYKGRVSTDLIGFPVVTFHFAQGLDLVLDVEAMFDQDREMDRFCMAVLPAYFQDLSVIGIRAQQYYNVAYDLASMKLYFQRIDCEVLD
ncbi:hypothetical protein TEA_000997 [Camellia sinensis var. sinensis]|uniref:Peptidase A1 domain-containing protein n=1 Tax=Camellia sinensis var. sinensis TaxID=542762 RepID=A0A4S4EUM1_CAMSN|nr:hypothetical protein TEA_000997 [Camellia sinensis var. sinensis]